MDSKQSRTIGAVDRTLEIIDLLEEHDELGVSELATKLDVSKGTVHCYLSSLVMGGYAIKNNGKYQLSLRYVSLGEAVKNRVEPLDKVEEQLNQLAREHGERVQFGVEENGQVVTLARATGSKAVTPARGIGQYEDMHCLGLGKAILAYFPKEKVNAIISNHGLKEKTENTITDQEVLHEELADIREKGYAIDEEEPVRGVRCIAVPLFENDETIVGAISVSGPVRRLTDGKIEDILDSLLESANVIEVNLSLTN